MIIKLCMDLVYAVLSVVFSGLSLVFPAETSANIASVMSDVFSYLEQGAGVVATFTHFSYLCSLLSCVIIIKTFFMGYNVLMWVLRKIPFWGVRE